MSSSKDTSDEELATNVLLDGCFILQRLLKYTRMAKRSSGEGNDEDDDWAQLIGRKWVWGTVKRDLLVLGNQVPFFVIQKLFKHLGRKSKSNSYDGERDGDNDILLYGGLQLFSSFHPRPMHASPIARHDVHHLLHLFYLSIDLARSSPWHRDSTRGQGPPQRKSALPPDLTWWAPSAEDLDAAGVRIRARDDGTATSFLDVKFHRGVLEIPPLKLFDYSEALFRNLIAFEQTYPFTPGRITTYAILMDCLLKTDEDVRLLHQSGVLVNRMNDERKYAATGFFSRLCAEARTSANRNHLADVMEEVVRYHRGRWPRWRAALVTNPWVTTSLVASAVLLGLTVLQTYYTAIAYYKPTK
ncbi:UPF0481 protein At3g47200-like [Triticum dicoccoides]|uniref:UPF0481 protein At3g47200-like n=1 Tax=Triticum dicoccoides TaxID=85692 RepID=UPI00189050D9|nr:UPF0481 protein At3g47200-like [Triticum dicoccoides]